MCRLLPRFDVWTRTLLISLKKPATMTRQAVSYTKNRAARINEEEITRNTEKNTLLILQQDDTIHIKTSGVYT